MPDAQTHLQQARHNEAFFDTIDVSACADWAVIALFYSAVQYVDAYLAGFNEHPGTHDQRERMIQSHPKMNPLRRHYRRLKDRSRDARYECVLPLGTLLPHHVEDLRLNDFEPVKRALV